MLEDIEEASGGEESGGPHVDGGLIEPRLEAARDPEEEFFMLSVLSHKLLHAEEFEDVEYV